MEQNFLGDISLLSFLLLTLILSLLFHKQRQKTNMPPSPPSLPLIGHLHLVKLPLHKSLKHLSCKYGPIFSLRFGNRLAVVISSPAAVQECFTKNDVVFANRPRSLAGKYLNYNYSTIGAAPYGPLWKSLRRIATLEILSGTRLNMFSENRGEETKLLVKNLYQKSSQNFAKVEIKSQITEMMINNIMTMFSGKRYYGSDQMEDDNEAMQFRDMIREMFNLLEFNPVEFLPFLKWIGFQNVERKMLEFQKMSDQVLQYLLDDQRSFPSGGKGTVIQALLSMQELEPESYSDETIKGFILILLAAGTDTSATTVEWAMSLLLNHPQELERARAELDKAIGQNRLIEEQDFPNLPYLQCIVNEAQRLFPATPLLVPHVSSSDCTIGSFKVPSNTLLLVNAWAIHRDPQIWDDPESFNPERFLSLKGDSIKFKFIPFGEGRRRCPGASLANRMVPLTLGSLIQCFDWERTTKELVDLSEGTGLTVPKAFPLEAICKPREAMVKVLAGL